MAVGTPLWTNLIASGTYLQGASGKTLRVLNIVGSSEVNQNYIIRGDLSSPHHDSQLCDADGGASYYCGVALGKSSGESYGMPPVYVDNDTVLMLRGASGDTDNCTTVYYTVVVDAQL